jgi:opacity protein-like surface antigen
MWPACNPLGDVWVLNLIHRYNRLEASANYTPVRIGDVDFKMRYPQMRCFKGERGMVRFAAAILLTVVIGSFAFAQDATPKVQVFGGYSLLRADHGGLTGGLLDVNLQQSSNPFALRNYFLDGWNAQAQYNVGRWFGVAADFGGRYGSPITASRGRTLAGLPNDNVYSLLAGPVFSYRTKSRLTPFVHTLFGWERTSVGASTITGSVTSPVPVTATTYNDVVMALGGGVDYRLTHHFSLRPGQLDWYHTSVNLNKLYTNAFSGSLFEGLRTNQINYRFSAGAVLRF